MSIIWNPKSTNEIKRFSHYFETNHNFFYVIMANPYLIIKITKYPCYFKNQYNYRDATVIDGLCGWCQNKRFFKLGTPYFNLSIPLAASLLRIKQNGANVIVDVPNDRNFSHIWYSLQKSKTKLIDMPLYIPQQNFVKQYYKHKSLQKPFLEIW